MASQRLLIKLSALTLCLRTALSVPSFDLDNRVFNLSGGYGVTLDVGTPPQKEWLMLCITCEPSSSYVVAKDAKVQCPQDNSCYPTTYPRFDSTASSTFKGNGSEDLLIFSGAYDYNTTGTYFTDKMSINGQELQGLSLGLAHQSSVRWGALAMGFSRQKPNMLGLLPYAKQKGLIAAEAFSLWLNGAYDKTGKLLLGAIDRSKFTGNLTFLPSDQTRPEKRLYRVSIRSMTIAGNDSKPIELLTSHPSSLAFFETTNTNTIMPSDVVDAIYRALLGSNGEELQKQLLDNEPRIPCSFITSDKTINLTFGDSSTYTTVAVPIADLISPIDRLDLPPDYDTSLFKAEDGTELCPFGLISVSPSTSDQSLFAFGLNAMWSMYLSWDVERKQIGIAQARKDITEEDIVEYGKDGIAGANTAAPTISGAGIPLQTETGGGSSATATPQASDKPSGSGRVEVGSLWVMQLLVVAVALMEFVV